MGNVVELWANKVEEKSPEDKGTEFLTNYLIPWASENGLDINSMKFKLNGTTILTCIQGMLLDGI